jgi:hypothetical protein
MATEVIFDQPTLSAAVNTSHPPSADLWKDLKARNDLGDMLEMQTS